MFIKSGIYINNCQEETIDGLTLISVEKGIYLIDSSIINIKNNEIRNFYRSGIEMYNCANVNIENNVIKLDEQPTDSQNLTDGLFIVDSNNCSISDNDINHALYGIDLINSSLINIEQNTVSSNKHGIRTRYSDNCKLEGNEINNNTQNGINCEIFTEFSIIENNHFSNNLIGLQIYMANQCQVLDNVFNDDGIFLAGFSDSHILSGNRFESGKYIYFYKNDHDGEIIPKDAGQIILVNCSNFIIEDFDTFEGDTGIHLVGSSNNIIRNNDLEDLDVSGIVLYPKLSGQYGNPFEESKNNIIENNRLSLIKSYSDDLYSNQIDGISISLFYATNNIINNNSIWVSGAGIGISESSDNTISNNTIESTEKGINLGYGTSQRNIFIYNDIIKNEIGVDFSYTGFNSHENVFYLNNFIDNSKHHAFDSNLNYWNSLKPISFTYNGQNYDNAYIGNYWDDYNGTDINNDEIGDNGYSILGGTHNVDNYPLMKPTHNFPPYKPEITGPSTNGKTRTEYTFTAITTDPNLDSIYYKFDWDDGTKTNWLGPFPPGDECSVPHEWKNKDTYYIGVRVKDTNGIESDSWGWFTFTIDRIKLSKNIIQFYHEKNLYFTYILQKYIDNNNITII